MLRAGTELAVERLRSDGEEAASHALAHIRLTDVAQMASELEARDSGTAPTAITTGAIYQLWPSQSAFQADLMQYVLREAPLPGAEILLPRTLELVAAGRGVDDIVAELITLAYEEGLQSPANALALLFVPYANAGRVGGALRETYAQLHVAARPIYQALLSYGRLRIREPWTLDDLMAAIAGLTEGIGIRQRIDPEAVAVRDGRSVLAEAAIGILRAFTEPAE